MGPRRHAYALPGGRGGFFRHFIRFLGVRRWLRALPGAQPQQKENAEELSLRRCLGEHAGREGQPGDQEESGAGCERARDSIELDHLPTPTIGWDNA